MNTTTPHTPTQTILTIARSYPSLGAILAEYNPDRFDPADFKGLLQSASSGQQLLIKIVLNIWSSTWASKHGCAINLVEIASRLDETHRTILAGWIQNPVYP
jgi:hypothetical protein